jgi:type I restriction enzyme, S subunit
MVSSRIGVEFYTPDKKQIEVRLMSSKFTLVKLGSLLEEPPMNGVDARIYQDNGQRYLRVQNIRPFEIDFRDARFVEAGNAKNVSLRTNDVLLTRKGTFGVAALVTEETKNDLISSEIVLLRVSKNSKCSPGYLVSWLNSPLAQQLLDQYKTGGIMGHITQDVINNFPVPLPNAKTQETLVKDLQEARASRKQKLARADKLLNSLDGWLLEQLGIKLSPAVNRKTFAVPLQEMMRVSRLNTEYFHPERLLTIRSIQEQSSHLQSLPLSQVVTFERDIRKSSDNRYLGLAHVQSNTGELVDADEEVTGNCFAFEQNDVLFARLRPYLNKVYRAEFAGVCSTEFHVIRIKDGDLIEPDYLATILRSSIILAQTKHMMTGNTHPRLTNEDVVNLVIPIPDRVLQKKVVSEVQERREEARRLRSEAESEWQAAKERFEAALLSGDNQ